MRSQRLDYKELLSEDEFARFAEMRKLRKQIAAEEAVPPYTVFTDAMLGEMAKVPELTLQSMQTISGIGGKKAVMGTFLLPLKNSSVAVKIRR